MKVKKIKKLVMGFGAAAVMGILLPVTVKADKTLISLNSIKSDYKCNNASVEYHFSGCSKDYNIIIDCPNNTVKVYLDSVTIDMLEDDEDDSEKKPAIKITDNTKAIIYVEGNNILEGGNTHHLINKSGYAGIEVAENASLTILGNGTLNVTGGGNDRGAAAIGGSYDDNCGMIIIGDKNNCPTIVANGGNGGAGIGGSEEGSSYKGIYIANGNITATGKNGGAGIGAGDAVAAGTGGCVDTIIITGGTITATGGSGAAGIGGSDSGSSGGSGDASNITISGGTITATGGSQGAGIGGGRAALVSNITITGGTITATGGKYGAGIGGGNSISAGDGGDANGIYISGGNITATGGESAAGIGGGDQSIVTGLEIIESKYQGLNITATGGKWGAGIGNGNSGVGSNNIGSILISLYGGTITATGGSQGAGIGGGNSTAKSITIKGMGTINATGYNESCAIGAGEKEDGGDILIEGISGSRVLIINAKALAKDGKDNDAAVIGSADSKGGSVTIKNATVYLTSVSDCFGSGIGAGKNQSMFADKIEDITIENCYIEDYSYASRIASSIGAGWSSAMGDITIKNSEIYGGSIGGTDNGNQLFKYKCIDEITIENSIIEADSENSQKAAIGSGRYSGVGKITITNSNITATSANGAGIGSGGYSTDSIGDFFKWVGCDAGDISISGSTVTATGGEGGAGIGGGWGTEVGQIDIIDSTITATGGEKGQDDKQGGAGIGGGHGESLGGLSIEGSTIVATGGQYAAGIGTGGYDTITTVMWNTECGYIYMANSNITATGGYGAAGIGTGYGAQFDKEGDIDIVSCEITATGGGKGAGIGAGANGWSGSGGEAPNISISDKSKVTATGGEGGAGIGGGFYGGCESVKISLSDTKYTNGDWLYYVKAYGGAGAAGIGSGGLDNDEFFKFASDTGEVVISGGYVYAKGGDDLNGAGAGIGGGAGGGKLKGFDVSGGFVVAVAGNSQKSGHRAFDIGGGGNDLKLMKDEDFKITGGTVIGNLSSEPDTIIIDGGSVSDNLDNAKRSDGTKVYRTRMQVSSPYYEIKNLKTSFSEYGTNDIFSDGGGIVSLYLPVSGDNAATADFEKYHYYGTTKTDGMGWIKQDLILNFKEPEQEALVGNYFILRLDDDNLVADIEFSIIGDCVSAPNLTDTAPGASVRLYGEDFGDFTVKATAKNIAGNMYWDGTGTYNGEITKSKATISYVQCLSKMYDGQPVSNPDVKTNSDGEITYKFYEDDVYLGDGVRPTECGSYYVIVSVAESENYSAAESNKMHFEITNCWIAMEMTATEDGGKATVEVELFDPYDDPGEITLKVNNGSPITVDVTEVDGRYIATHTFDTVAGDNSYTVTASYARTRNYRAVGDVTKTFDKSLATRTITVQDISTTYGSTSAPTAFTVTPSEGVAGACTYEVVYDFDKLNHEFTNTITVDETTGAITYLNAGIAYVKITMTDSTGVYDDAVAYAKVTVARKPISIYSYAYLADDVAKNPVTSVEYGKIDTLLFGLKYGNSTDVPTDFTGVGSLEALPINETTGVGTGKRIEIVKISGDVEIGGNTYNTFISRNYLITYVPGEISITPAELEIVVDAAVGAYGCEPEYTYTFGYVDGSKALMPWDDADDVVDTVGLSGGQSYFTLMPGVYDDIVIVTPLINPNYVIDVEAGDLRVSKGSINVDVTAESKMYDKLPLNAQVNAAADISEAAAGNVVEEIGAVSVTYYKINEDGTVTELMSAPINVGQYYVKAVVAENDYYVGEEVITYFRISKAKYDIDTPILEDIYMKEGLLISEQLLPSGWQWVNPAKELEVGAAYGYAIYTPQDAENYYKVVRKLNFDVLDPNGDNDVDVDTGAMLLLIKICFVTCAAALVGAIIIIFTRKKK